MCYVALDLEAELDISHVSAELEQPYELPDGNVIPLREERFRCPEVLFQPALMNIEAAGIHRART